MVNALDFLRHVYTIFGFTFCLRLSTRPDKYLGELEMWENAEKVCYFIYISELEMYISVYLYF